MKQSKCSSERRVVNIASAAILVIGLLFVSGCSPNQPINTSPIKEIVSPLSGTWRGKSDVKGGDLQKFANSIAGGPLTGPSTLTLKPDGTGFIKVADRAERPISWKQEDDRVIMQYRRVDDSKSPSGSENDAWVGDLSSDRRTMTIDLDNVKVTVKHEEKSGSD